MGTETRYLIGPGAKLWKTGVSISSDVIGSAIGTGEIKKTHIHLLSLYIHIILQILYNQSPAVFIYINIQTFVYLEIQKQDAEELQHARHESPVYDRREN